MSYEFLPFVNVSWSDAFSASAMTFSVAALLAALRVYKEIKRKVDGELGELAPNFALFPATSSLPAREGTRTPRGRGRESLNFASTTTTGGQSGLLAYAWNAPRSWAWSPPILTRPGSSWWCPGSR
jgi:hypothetical protein